MARSRIAARAEASERRLDALAAPNPVSSVPSVRGKGDPEPKGPVDKGPAASDSSAPRMAEGDIGKMWVEHEAGVAK